MTRKVQLRLDGVKHATFASTARLTEPLQNGL